MNRGVFSDRGILSLIEQGGVSSEKPINKKEQVQPSSLDLRVGNDAFGLPFSSFPKKGIKLKDYFDKVKNYKFKLSDGGFLHKGQIYILKLQESLNLPPHIYAKANPKSSTGRVDVHVRLITENGEKFDEVPAGYKGELWLEIFPRTFDIVLREGTALNQIRFFDIGSEPLYSRELHCLHRDCTILYNENKKPLTDNEILNLIRPRSGIDVTVNLKGKCIGYVARKNAPVVDLSRRDLDLNLYFDEILSPQGHLIVDKDSFYILASNEIVNIPDSSCSEMLDVNTGSGEFRSHYAGFFDPGFCSVAVLELRNYGQPFLLRHGQRVAGFDFFRLKDSPLIKYGSEKGSNYQGQKGPRVAKYFLLKK